MIDIPRRDKTGPPDDSKGPQTGLGQGKGHGRGKGIGKKKGGKLGNC